ncbi:hypothetical protein [Fibrobacter sp.]|uniref:hypothetical protein n=1 Tax=Fibrobacter sp. TaxID=35828 RepID=UPI0025BE0081|nr:hypothetical protein [Fibrobacter sp.]
MNTYINTNIFRLGLLCVLSLTACSEDTASSQNFGTTEEKNAFWNDDSNLKAWNVMEGSGIELDASKKTLAGRVSLAKAGGDGLSRAGIVFDVSNPDGSPVDLSENSGGLCVTYQSDFDVEVRLDDGDYASSSVDKDLPYASFAMKDDGDGTHCVSWENFEKKKSDKDDESFAKKVRSVQIVFVGEPGASGIFDIQRLAPYVRWEMWWSKTHGDRVNTGFEEGDAGTSGKLTLFGSLAEDDVVYTDRGLKGNVVFDDSKSNPDVGIQFLVAGKTTENGSEVIHSADVTTKWKGICLEYESQMDIEMQLVPENAGVDNILKLTFAKNDNASVGASDGGEGVSNMETVCYEFADVPNANRVLNNLTTVRLKFVKENNSGTRFYIKRISYLLPENLSVRDVGEYKEIVPTVSSTYKSGKSFLWNGAVDGDRVNLGIANATSGGIWTNSPEETGAYDFNFPNDVVADSSGNVIPSLVNKYHKFKAYVKFSGGIILVGDSIVFVNGLDDATLGNLAYIGFNTVSSNQEPADISAWGGFCVHYSTYNSLRIAIVTDASANKYWYADVDYSNDMTWGKVSWNAFKNIEKGSSEKIEDVLGKVTAVQLQFDEGETVVDKFGSYDQCGK